MECKMFPSQPGQKYSVCDVRDVSEEGVSGEGVLVVTAEIVVVSNLKFESYVNYRGCKAEVLKLSKAFGECTKWSKSEIEQMCEQCHSEYDTRRRRWERIQRECFSDVVEERVKGIEGEEDFTK